MRALVASRRTFADPSPRGAGPVAAAWQVLTDPAIGHHLANQERQ
jgi:hypothetical protein